MRVLQVQPVLAENKSISKASMNSGKIIGAKKQKKEEVLYESVYFSNNPMIDMITKRGEKEIKQTKLFNRKQLGKGSRYMEDLFERQKGVVKKIENMRKEISRKMENQCTFQPSISKPSKFVFQGDIVRRNQIWLEEKKKRNIQRKQESLFQDLSNCTFSPSIASKQSSMYLNNKNFKKDRRKTEATKKYSHTQRSTNPNRQPNESQFQARKRQIFNRLNNNF